LPKQLQRRLIPDLKDHSEGERFEFIPPSGRENGALAQNPGQVRQDIGIGNYPQCLQGLFFQRKSFEEKIPSSYYLEQRLHRSSALHDSESEDRLFDYGFVSI
jgi:hypothetical protein